MQIDFRTYKALYAALVLTTSILIASPAQTQVNFAQQVPLATNGIDSFTVSGVASQGGPEDINVAGHVEAADLDGDGDMDVIVANPGSDDISLLLNNGDGTFASAEVRSTGGLTPVFVLAADINGDGRPDLVVLNAGTNDLSIFRNDSANGTLALTRRLPSETGLSITGSGATGNLPIAVTAADFNEDTRLDLAVAILVDHSVSVFFQQSDGTFDDPVTGAEAVNLQPTGCCLFPTSLSAAELTGDNSLDMVVANIARRQTVPTDRILVWVNNPDQATRFVVETDFANPDTTRLLDDPDLDLGFRELECEDVDTNPNEDCHTASVTAADLDGDGDTDIAIANELSPSSFGTLVEIPLSLTSGVNELREATALTYWGTERVFLRAETDGDLFRLTPAGAATFIATLDHVAKGLAFSLDALPVLYSIARDQDSDQRVRLRVIDPTNASTTSSVVIALTNEFVCGGNGLATHPTTGELWALLRLTSGGEDCSRLRAGRELVTINPATGVATSIGNTGENTFDRFESLAFDDAGTLYGITGLNASPPETLYTLSTNDATPTLFLPTDQRNASGQALGFNPDNGLLYQATGNPPIFESINITGTSGSGLISVLRNEGNGMFTRTDLSMPSGTAPVFITAADLNSDGNRDLAVVNRNTNNVSVLTNTGNGTFTEAQNFAVGAAPRAAAAADLDNDCDLDLAVVNRDDNTVSVLINQALSPDPGDISGNGLSPDDARLALRQFLRLENLDACRQNRADINQDGVVTPADALCIFQVFLNIPSCLS